MNVPAYGPTNARIMIVGEAPRCYISESPSGTPPIEQRWCVQCVTAASCGRRKLGLEREIYPAVALDPVFDQSAVAARGSHSSIVVGTTQTSETCSSVLYSPSATARTLRRKRPNGLQS
jgi:hypothetical protein